MYQIAMAESGGKTDAYGTIAPGERSHGIWQINVGEGGNTDLVGMDLTDPEQNARAARIVYDRQGPTAWSTYGGGDGMTEPMSTYQARSPQQAFDATTVLTGIINAMPKPEQYKDTPYESAATQYSDDLVLWQGAYASAFDTVKLQQEMNAGLVRMEDGTIVSQADFDRLDPTAQAQVQARFIQQQRDLDNSWADLVNSLGLTEFQTRQDVAFKENDLRSNNFQNRMDEFKTRLGLDEMNQNTAVRQVDRQLSGLQESRGRATLIQDALDKAAGWATGGKTSFTPADFGQAMSVIAQFGGIAPDMPFLKFPGTRRVDPAALLTAQDEALGVTGQLPQIPNLLTSASGIPSSPQLLAMPTNVPSFIRPTPPVQLPVPTASPPQRTLSEILGMPPF